MVPGFPTRTPNKSPRAICYNPHHDPSRTHHHRPEHLSWQTLRARTALPGRTRARMVSSGMTHEEILADYPDLEREDIFAVLEFATQLSRVKRLEFAGA
jgi:hypothetical protein